MTIITDCIIYAAKSTEDIGGSIPTQRQDCRDRITFEGGRRIAAEHEDESASAFRQSRGPGLAAAKAAAIAAAAAGATVELWVQHSDRLARGDGLVADHLVQVFFELRRAGVMLRSVQDDSTFSNPMLAAAIGERNREDSARKSAAVRAGKRRRFEAGKAHGGPIHDGYMLSPALDGDGNPMLKRDGRIIHTRVRDPERAPIYERIMDMLEGGATFGEIARGLNRAGLVTQRGIRWTTRRIRETAMNPFYAGWIVQYGERIAGTHERLIDPERWQRIQDGFERLPARTASAGGRVGTHDFLLRGIARCGLCGSPMYARHPARGRRFYRCREALQISGLCRGGQIRADIADAQVLARLRTFIGDIEAWLSARASDDASERAAFASAIERQEREVARIERRVTRARQQYDELLDDDELAATALREIARIERDRDHAIETVAQAREHLEQWPSSDVDAAIDYYSELRDAIAGRLPDTKSIGELNATLRTVLDGVWMHTAHDDDLGEILLAEFVCRTDDRIGPPPAISLATRMIHWRRLLDQGHEITPVEYDPGTLLACTKPDATPSCRSTTGVPRSPRT